MTKMAKHNKKRNVGLIHEQLVRHISECMVNQDQKSADVAINILENHFNKDSELYREFRLFNSLVHTQVKDSDLARRIIQESKAACRRHNAEKLRREKSSLIKDINYKIDNKNFYSKKIQEYKIFSTVQALLNEWRGKGNLFPEEKVRYELVLESWLSSSSEAESIKDNAQANPLVLRLMMEKFNKKYGNRLNDRQRSLLNSKISQDRKAVIEQVSQLKSDAVYALGNFYKDCDNNFLLSKKKVVMERIKSLEVESSDMVVERALSLAALIDELENGDE